MNKQKKLTLTFIALLVLAIVIAGIALLVKRYMPSNREMALTDYFKVSEGEMQVILQDQIYDTKALYENGQIYVDYGSRLSEFPFLLGFQGEPAVIYYFYCSDIRCGRQSGLLYQ